MMNKIITLKHLISHLGNHNLSRHDFILSDDTRYNPFSNNFIKYSISGEYAIVNDLSKLKLYNDIILQIQQYTKNTNLKFRDIFNKYIESKSHLTKIITANINITQELLNQILEDIYENNIDVYYKISTNRVIGILYNFSDNVEVFYEYKNKLSPIKNIIIDDLKKPSLELNGTLLMLSSKTLRTKEANKRIKVCLQSLTDKMDWAYTK